MTTDECPYRNVTVNNSDTFTSTMSQPVTSSTDGLALSTSVENRSVTVSNTSAYLNASPSIELSSAVGIGPEPSVKDKLVRKLLFFTVLTNFSVVHMHCCILNESEKNLILFA